MERIFELIKNESISDGASEEFLNNISYYVEKANEYWIALNQRMPQDGETVLAFGSLLHSYHISYAIVVFDKTNNIFIESDQEFRVFGWRPLPKLSLVGGSNE